MKIRLLLLISCLAFVSLNSAVAQYEPIKGPLHFYKTPADGPDPVFNEISAAKKSVDIMTYGIQDTSLVKLIISISKGKQKRVIRVIINLYARDGNSHSQYAIDALSKAGVSVRLANQKRFPLTHANLLIIDAGQPEQKAFIMSMDLTPAALGEGDPFNRSLNYGVITFRSDDVKEMEAIFNADWTGTDYTPAKKSPYVVSPANASFQITDLIQNARYTIYFISSDLNDPFILKALQDALLKKKAKVQGLIPADMPSALVDANKLKAMGAEIRYSNSPYPNASTVIVDGSRIYIGSAAFNRESLSKNREVGMIFEHDNMITEAQNEFFRYWDHASLSPNREN